MSVEESDSSDLKDENSTSEEDKKFVSQGVAFVIGHTRNGFVALCASVATLLKEQAKLKLENEALKSEIASLKSKQLCVPAKNDSCKENLNASLSQDSNELPVLLENGIQYSNSFNYKRFKRKDFKDKGYRALKGCLCDRCTDVTGNTCPLSVPLQIGKKVVISGEICGTVQYVGHVDSFGLPEIFIGLHLDEAVGDSTGTVGKKTYFTVPPRYGLFVPLLNVCCIMN